jgi:hypothetical protein|tara:strand:+ start:434 stop:634 length:201 start_codon:yes stop_codon:yes gene_type:complete
MRILLSIFIYYHLLITPSYAYLDPGSASVILQAILGGIAAAGATIALYWRKFKDFFLRIFRKKNKN